MKIPGGPVFFSGGGGGGGGGAPPDPASDDWDNVTGVDVAADDMGAVWVAVPAADTPNGGAVGGAGGPLAAISGPSWLGAAHPGVVVLVGMVFAD
jgi:hypothetical protein